MGFLAFAIFIVVIYVIYKSTGPKKVGAVHSNWCHYFTHLQFSTQEFYSLVEEIITTQEIPNIQISRVSYHEFGLLSNKREYLRISRKEDIFDICAAPFGTGFFVSYWLGEPKHAMRDLAKKVPYLNTAMEGFEGESYFQIDTASMFKGCVKDSIMEAIDQITTNKGVRGLSEYERNSMYATK